MCWLSWFSGPGCWWRPTSRASSRILNLCAWPSICFHGPSSKFLDLLPPASLPPQKQKRRAAHVFCGTKGHTPKPRQNQTKQLLNTDPSSLLPPTVFFWYRVPSWYLPFLVLLLFYLMFQLITFVFLFSSSSLSHFNSVQTRCIVKGEAQKSPLFWRFSGGFWFSEERLFCKNSTRKPLNLIKSPIFTNTPSKSTCLHNECT